MTRTLASSVVLVPRGLQPSSTHTKSYYIMYPKMMRISAAL